MGVVDVVVWPPLPPHAASISATASSAAAAAARGRALVIGDDAVLGIHREPRLLPGLQSAGQRVGGPPRGPQRLRGHERATAGPALEDDRLVGGQRADLL